MPSDLDRSGACTSLSCAAVFSPEAFSPAAEAEAIKNAPLLMQELFSHRRLNKLPIDQSRQQLLRALLCKCVALICVTAGVLLPSISAQRENVNLERDFPILASRVRTNQPADYVIVIDRSGSMRSFWPLVRQSVASFLEAVPDGDYVSVVEFGTDARNSITPRPVNQQTRSDLLREVSNLPEPTDSATDIGRAMEKTLDELNRPNGNRLKFVFFLSDFAHDPPSQSPYYRKHSPQDDVWRRLTERMRSEQSENAVQAYALLLPIGGSVGRDLPLGRAIFPRLESVNVNQATLLPWFERRKAEIARDKLRAIVEQDAARLPLAIKSIEQRGDRLVAVFDLVVDRLVETSSFTDIQISELAVGDLQSRLTPEPTINLNLSVSGAGSQTVEIPIARVGEQSTILRWTAGNQITFKLNATQNIEPAGEITRLNLPTARTFEVSVRDKEAIIKGGYLPIWVLVVTGVILLLIVLTLLRYYRQEYIVGEITVVGHGAPITLRPESKRKTFKIGDVSNSEGIAVKGAQWVLLFQSFKPPERARGTYIRMERGQAMLNKKVALNNQKWEPVQRGSIIDVKSGKTVAFK